MAKKANHGLRFTGGDHLTPKDGFKYYIFGHSPNNREDGFINIKTLKGETNGGEMKYWTVLRYGPVNFVNPSDEI